MDAVKFIKERNRMCKFYFDAARVCCSNNCPAYHLDCNCCALGHLDEDNESLVEVVEKWSKENPIKTIDQMKVFADSLSVEVCGLRSEAEDIDNWRHILENFIGMIQEREGYND